MKTKMIIPALAFFVVHNVVNAQPSQITFTLFSNGTLDSITDLVNAGDNRMFVVEQHGFIAILDSAGNVMPKPFLDISDKVGTMGSEEGLLGLAFSPNYKTDRYFYIHYTDSTQAVNIARYQVSNTNPDSAIKSSEVSILKIHHPYTNHNGGNIAFGPDGYLYDGIGDGGSSGDPGNRAQNTDSLLGKLLRINVDTLPYKIPPTNPFATNGMGRPEIWAYGLRNPWCWSFDKFTGDLWIGDVGQSLYEEVDFQPAHDTGGQNYGWRCYEGDASYNFSNCSGSTNFTFPVDTYTHSNFNGCAVIGGYVYRGAQYNSMFGKYFCSDYCSSRFRSIKDSAGVFVTTVLNRTPFSELTKFGQDIYGELYFAENDPGVVYKIGDTVCAPVAFISFNDTTWANGDTSISALYGQGLTYKWTKNDTVVGTNNILPITHSGTYTVTVTNGRGCSSSANQFVKINATGINKLEIFKNIQIVPNPNKGDFDLNVSTPSGLSSTISVTDVLGRTLLTEYILLNVGKNTIHISKGNLTSGIYFVKINSQQVESVIKFVVTE